MIKLVEIIKYVVLGIVQGFTEPLPISSSGHLIIGQTLFNLATVDYFMEIVLHFASMLAIVFLFRKKIGTLIYGNLRFIFKRDQNHAKDFHFIVMILIACIPIVLFGWLFNDFFESLLSLTTVGISLLVTGTFLLLVKKQSTDNVIEDLSYLDALTIGLFQVVALLPGISRSGSTFVGGLFRRIRFETVIEFSFILYIPVSVGAMVFEMTKINDVGSLAYELIVPAFVASLIATYYAFKFFVAMVRKGNLHYFAYYCFGVGVLTLAYVIIF